MDVGTMYGVVGGILVAALFFLILGRLRRKKTTENTQEEPFRAETVREEHYPEPEPVVTEQQLRADLAKAQTAEEYRAVYNLADSGSGIERDAINGMLAAIRKDITDATSVRECKLAINPIKDHEFIGADAVRREAFEKILSLTASASDARELYDTFTDQYNDEVFASRIAQSIVDLVRVELAKADTTDTCWSLINDTLPSDAIGADMLRREALEKILSLTASASDVRELHESYTNEHDDEVFANRIAARFVELAHIELLEANTVDDCWNLINDTLPSDAIGDSDTVLNAAFDKILALVSTTEEALSFYSEYSAYDDEDEFPDQILKRALELAENAEDANDVYQETEDGSELQHRSILRELEFATSVDECQSIWDEHGVDHQYGQLAIVRAAEIISTTIPSDAGDVSTSPTS